MQPTSPELAGRTLVDVLSDVAARSAHVVRFIGAEDETTTWSEIIDHSERRAGALRRLGVDTGQRVGIQGPTSRALVEAVIGTWFSGGVPLLLPPLRSGPSALLRERLQQAGVELLLRDGSEVCDEPAGVRTADLRSLEDAPFTAGDIDDTAVVQFTSGSTGAPKCIRLSHEAVLANLAAIHEAVDLDPDVDTSLSWLPLYHDMGFVGTFLGAAVAGMEATFGATEHFALRPGLWMRSCSELGSTIIAGSDHAFALAARSLRRAHNVDLKAVRVAMCGGEVIRRSTLEAFDAAAKPHGWRRSAFMPCYGLAEATLAVTMTPAESEPSFDDCTGSSLDTDDDLLFHAAGGMVGVGRAVRGCEVRIGGVDGEGTGRGIGEIIVRSRALMDGYEHRGRLDRSGITDSWLCTGDLGYMRDGELFVCGRRKEIIVLNGRNVAPAVLEQLAGAMAGVRTGGAAAFAWATEDGGEEAVLAVEPTRRGEEHELARAVGRHLVEEVGFRPRRVVVVRPGSLPRTTSGKVRRTGARSELASGALEVIGEHTV